MIDEEFLKVEWQNLLSKLESQFGKKPDLNGVLLLIGVQELGQGVRAFSKEEKQDLMHIAICRLLSKEGIYVLEGTDKDGWPHWKLVDKLPFLDLLSQEKLLKNYAIDYFKDIFED